MATDRKVQWIVNFEGGGWNIVIAHTKQQAYDEAIKRYNSEHTKVQSVTIATYEKIDALMSLFW